MQGLGRCPERSQSVSAFRCALLNAKDVTVGAVQLRLQRDRVDLLLQVRSVVLGSIFCRRRRAPPWWHIGVPFGAGLLTATGQFLLTRPSSGNAIDITAAIWFQAGRLPALRTLGSATLSVLAVGMGTALGREGTEAGWRGIANKMSDCSGETLVAIFLPQVVVKSHTHIADEDFS